MSPSHLAPSCHGDTVYAAEVKMYSNSPTNRFVHYASL